MAQVELTLVARTSRDSRHRRAMNAMLTTADGLELHVQRWPVGGSARGTVVIVHGLGEHIGRYAHVARQLNEWGWNAVGSPGTELEFAL